MADLIAIAETLEAQAAALRREAARQAQEGQAELELAEPAPDSWASWEGGEQPPATYGKTVDIRTRDGAELTLPASACVWEHHDKGDEATGDITAFRISAEQPAE